MEKGISLYAGMGYDPEEMRNGIELAARYGFTRLFTSLHVPEAENDQTINDFRLIVSWAKVTGLEVVADISPRTFRFLGAAKRDVTPLKELGIAALRLDYGFTPAEIAWFTRSEGMKIQLNASTIDFEQFELIRAAGADLSRVEALHNFYPRPESGLSYDLLVERSRMWRQFGIRVYAFLPSAANPRGPVKAGLPTVEVHRFMDSVAAAKHLAVSGVLHGLYFGDPLPDERELAGVAPVNSETIVLRVSPASGLSEIERQILFDRRLRNRVDAAERMVRASETRDLYDGQTIVSRPPLPRPKGTVAVDNERYTRYMGELHVSTTDLPADERVNVLGRVVDAEVFLVDHIKPGQPFYFVEA
ncbi:MAG: MupG family TIM beta-alpha barrel fold protein [Negativicutes bacterium]|nr:MupG family TIM beta-alpha barrel fold protein [Negativicutes bacterium]